MTHGGYTLRTPRGGCILEFTCVGGLAPSLITGHGQDFHLGSLRPMVHGELARGMAHGGRILLGNHEIARTNGSTPIFSYCTVQTRHMGKLDSTVEPCPRQRLQSQRDAMSQSTHEQQNQLPPHSGVTSVQEAGCRHATQG